MSATVSFSQVTDKPLHSAIYSDNHEVQIDPNKFYASSQELGTVGSTVIPNNLSANWSDLLSNSHSVTMYSGGFDFGVTSLKAYLSGFLKQPLQQSERVFYKKVRIKFVKAYSHQ